MNEVAFLYKSADENLDHRKTDNQIRDRRHGGADEGVGQLGLNVVDVVGCGAGGLACVPSASGRGFEKRPMYLPWKSCAQTFQ